ncbi:MAG: DUF368 domain-containing protein [Bacilli bacterium]|nr:DUF368 domain-containing protein [Bacilli bacterium]
MKKFLKGIIIGIGKIMPGVSGAMLAISLNVYEKMLEAISNILKKPKQSIKYLFSLALGMLFSIIIFSKFIKFCLDKYYLYTIALFIGLMLGGLYNFARKKIIINYKNFAYFFISFMFVFLLPIMLKFTLKIEKVNLIYLIFMGVLDAFATIVPGVSGTALLMIFNCYNLIINSFSNIFSIESIIILFPFFIGFIFGGFMLSKIMNNLYNKLPDETNSSILGFAVSSMLILLLEYIKNINLNNILSFFLIIIGFIISKFLDN